MRVKFVGRFLKQDKIIFSHGNGKYINCLWTEFFKS